MGRYKISAALPLQRLTFTRPNHNVMVCLTAYYRPYMRAISLPFVRINRAINNSMNSSGHRNSQK